MNRAELQQLAADRIADAKGLLSLKRWTAAYYLAGYAVECGLKACIARLTQAEDFPDKSFAEKCWTHDLGRLVLLAGLEDSLEQATANDANLGGNWKIVKDWKEASRYRRIPKNDAEDLYTAIADKKHGVLTWVRLHW